jgi:hypothetical protein
LFYSFQDVYALAFSQGNSAGDSFGILTLYGSGLFWTTIMPGPIIYGLCLSEVKSRRRLNVQQGRR